MLYQLTIQLLFLVSDTVKAVCLTGTSFFILPLFIKVQLYVFFNSYDTK